MNALAYLFFTKMKATIRNIFRKPLSAILTLAALAFMAFMIFVIVTSDNISLAANVTSIESMMMMLIGYIALMLGIMLMQKRTALVKMDDAFFIFAGPFSRQQILAYVAIDTIKGSSLYALISVFYAIMLMADVGLTLPFILFLAVLTCLVYFIIFMFITYLYFLDIVSSRVKLTKRIIFACMIAAVLLLYVKNLFDVNFDFALAFRHFLSDPTFYVVPVLGWMKWAAVSLTLGNYINMAIALCLLILAAIGLSVLILTVKGDFYEKAIDDASWYSDLRKGMKEGKQANINLKIKEVKDVRMAKGAKAIFSKNMLELRKTKSWIRKQDLFLMLFYLLIAKLMGMDFTFYQYYILIVLAMSVNTDFVITELKKPYVYLIPEKPMAKMIWLLLPVVLRMFILILIGLVPAWIVYRVDVLTFVVAVVNLIGYALIFVGSTVWSLRLMKSRNNILVEQFLKIIVILIAIIPAVAVTILIMVFVPMSDLQVMAVASVASLIVNIIVGSLFIQNAKAMLKGTSLMAD